MQSYQSNSIDLNEIRRRVALAPPAPPANTERNRALTIFSLIAGILFVFFLAQPRSIAAEVSEPSILLAANLDYSTDSTSLDPIKRLQLAKIKIEDHRDWASAFEAGTRSTKSGMLKAVRTSDNRNQLTIPSDQQALFYIDPNTDDILSVAYQLNETTNRQIIRSTGGEFLVKDLKARLTSTPSYATATVETSLQETLTGLNLPSAYAEEIANAFPNDWTLSSGGEAGDKFELVYETLSDERGREIGPGNLLYVSYDGKVASDSRYFFAPTDTRIRASFDSFGKGAEPILTRDPVNGKRITSAFGRRVHPVKGYSHLHTGIDFGARMGANVYAAGDGVVEQMRMRSGYGRYLMIRHADGYATAYAHLSGFERNLKVGQVVRRGELIGYVGMSGTVTGPHLHFEVKKNGRFLNPMRVKLPEGRNLSNTPEEYEAFRQFKTNIDTVRHTKRSDLLLDVKHASQSDRPRTQLSP